MNKHLVGGVVIVGLVSLIAILFLNQQTAEAPHAELVSPPEQIEISTTTEVVATSSESAATPKPPVSTTPKPQNTFSGTLTEVNTGCFADGECFAVVGGKHVTLVIGRKQEVSGSVVGAPSIGDLESYIGETATVYAKALPDGTFTLYGNTSYYLAVTPKTTKGCVVGGCSSQLCGEEGQDLISTCEWTAKYSCYQKATCERQPSGQCGWTETPELLQCIADADRGRLDIE
ncbi:MAG: hypothetical protein RLZZ360_720 [Candidatus Parcubacteria bacterium]|jgi:hypothetical protein